MLFAVMLFVATPTIAETAQSTAQSTALRSDRTLFRAAYLGSQTWANGNRPKSLSICRQGSQYLGRRLALASTLGLGNLYQQVKADGLQI